MLKKVKDFEGRRKHRTSHKIVITNELVRGIETTVILNVDTKATEVMQCRQLHLVVLTDQLGVWQVVASLQSPTHSVSQLKTITQPVDISAVCANF